MKPPIEMLVDSFDYEEILDDKGDWGKTKYAESKKIRYCRIDRESVYTSSSSGKTLLFNGVIFCYSGLTTPFAKFKEQSKITYDGVEHIITKVIPVTEVYSSDLFSIELEVV